MNRWGLSSKIPSSLEKTRKSAASDPNVIYGYFDTVESLLVRLKITQRPECLWNIDETNLHLDPQKTKVIAPKGVKASRTTATSGREAVSVMAGISAAGQKLPPSSSSRGRMSWQTGGQRTATLGHKSQGQKMDG